MAVIPDKMVVKGTFSLWTAIKMRIAGFNPALIEVKKIGDITIVRMYKYGGVVTHSV